MLDVVLKSQSRFVKYAQDDLLNYDALQGRAKILAS